MLKLVLSLAIVAAACAQNCVDTIAGTQCASWKTAGYCNNNYVQTNCCATCGTGVVSTPTNTVISTVGAGTPVAGCTANTETATQCNAWKTAGYCNNQHVLNTCCVTCAGVTVASAAPTAAPVPAPTAAPTYSTILGVCVDYHSSASECANWKSLGYCTFPAWSTWMNQMCNKHCTNCTPFRCNNVEADAQCASSAAQGMCTSAAWSTWMSTNCKKACGLCQPRGQTADDCTALTYTQLLVALSVVTCGEPECKSTIPASAVTNGAASPKHSWGAYVNRAGVVCSVVRTGPAQNDQSPFGRLEALTHANTANDFSSNTFAMSSANVYGYAQPGGSLYGGGASTPINSQATGGLVSAYGFECGNAVASDAACGLKIGGFNPTGGGVPLYDHDGVIVGSLGVGGDDACVAHNIAWKTRTLIGLRKTTMTDNINYATTVGDQLANTNKHASCSSAAQTVSAALS